MAETKIEWARYTFNCWRGCTKVSAGCTNCYAESMSGRNPGTLGVWGPNGTRVVAAESYWRQPLKWDREAKAAGERRRVFCASLADVFEDWTGPMVNVGGQRLVADYVTGEWDTFRGDSASKDECDRWVTMATVRERLFQLISDTPNLDWLLLTKRPENIERMMRPRPTVTDPCPVLGGGDWLPNVWLGVSVEDQQRADERIPLLLRTPAAVRFLSCEPLLEDVGTLDLTGIHWVIVGGESGHGARTCNLAWVRSLIRQCQSAAVPAFCKQLGSLVFDSDAEPFCEFESENQWVCKARSWLGGISGGGQKYKKPEKVVCLDTRGRHCEFGKHFMRATEEGTYPVRAYPLFRFHDPKGGDMTEWPSDLRVRDFPVQ